MFEKLLGLWVGEGDDSYLSVSFDKLFDLLATVALYVTIALVVAVVIYAIVIRNRDEVEIGKARKLIVGMVAGYSIGVISILGTFKLLNYVMDEKINKNFWLLIGLFALMIVGLVVTIVLKKRNIKGYQWSALAFAIAFVVYAVVLACVIPANKEKYEPLNGQNWQMALVTIVLVAVIVALSILGSKDDSYDAKALTYGAVCVALAFALSYVKFFSLPQGGSVTFASMLPIILYSFMFGTRRGLVVGVVYGMLQFIQSPQFYQPMQALLDYPIAFGALGVAAIAKRIPFVRGNLLREFAVGSTIAILLRYFSHVVSGYYVFSSWAMEGYTAVSWAFVYNMFVFADLAIVLIIGIAALATKTLKRTIIEAQTSQE